MNPARTARAMSWAVLALAVLGGCASRPPAPDAGESPWAEQTRLPPTAAVPSARWEHHAFPGKASTRFSYARKDGRDAIRADARSSASALRLRLRLAPQALGTLQFAWFVPALIDHADMRLRDVDDSPARVVLLFEGDRSRFSTRDAMLSELAQALTGEPMPYATLMYVWSNQRPAGEVIRNPRTDRIRKIVVQSGPAGLNRWLDFERDVRADFQRAFGEPPGALVGIGLMTDSDNTRSSAQAWYGPLRLDRAAVPVPAP